MNRRHFLATSAAALAATSIAPTIALARNKRMGVSMATYAIRWRSETPSERFPGFTNALDILEHCRQLNAGGAQVSVRGWADGFAGEVRDRREELGLYLEGQIRLPREDNEVDRFDMEIRQGIEAGMSIFRTVCLGGRRYETFDSKEAFETFKKASYEAIERAEKVMRRHRVKLAVENHKDWRAPEMTALLRHFESEWIGVNLDLGNNISLMEDGMAVIEALAPYTMTTHFKDMAMEDYEDGFLLSEVPLGAGVLDLKKAVEICERHNPNVTYNLEMITRDPLKIPCLTDGYWATFEDVRGIELARTLRTVHRTKSDRPLQTISNLNPEERLKAEDDNNRLSFEYAENVLGLR